MSKLSLPSFACVLALAACASPPNSDARVVTHGPDATQFRPVGLLLDRRCGTLDCHGIAARNLRLYGFEGQRLAPTDVPGGNDTTQDELDYDYRSLVGDDPENVGAVVADHGAHPERILFVRKARGAEGHVGGVLMIEGDDEDTCVTSWLAGATDVDACARATFAVDPQAQ